MNPFVEVLGILIDLYISIILIRFFLQYFRADFYNPLSQFVVRATDPLVKPIRKIIPGFGGIDISTMALAYLLVVCKFLLLLFVFGQFEFNLVYILLVSVASLSQTVLKLFMYLILIRVVISWVSPSNYNPIILAISQITQPIIDKFRKWTPSTDGIDLSIFITGLALFLTHQSISYWVLPAIFKIAY